MPLSFLILFIVTSHVCFCGINGINTILLRQMYHVKISTWPNMSRKNLSLAQVECWWGQYSAENLKLTGKLKIYKPCLVSCPEMKEKLSWFICLYLKRNFMIICSMLKDTHLFYLTRIFRTVNCESIIFRWVCWDNFERYYFFFKLSNFISIFLA